MSGDSRSPERTAAQQEMLANRLRKKHKHLARWAKREGIDAYRLYDRDIPEVPLAVDRYAGCLYVAGYARAHENEAEEAREQAWLLAMREAAATALGVSLEDTALKRRERQRGTAQYERQAATGRRIVVHEGGHRFYVNLWDYLDTGLFLDHRKTRARVAEESRGKRVLNLYSYTGSFGVYAQAAGALHVTQVDLSRTYLDWARDNLRLNKLDDKRHALVHEDAARFLARAADQGDRWDIVVVDPPTFSNSKRMDGTFDVRRDHSSLLDAIARVLEPSGACFFSTNARGFQLTGEATGSFSHAEDLTEQTRSLDFEGRHSHRAWRLSP